MSEFGAFGPENPDEFADRLQELGEQIDGWSDNLALSEQTRSLRALPPYPADLPVFEAQETTGLKARTGAEALNNVRGLLASLDRHESLRSQELFPERFAPHRLERRLANYYWRSQLRVDVPDVAIVPSETLGYFVDQECRALAFNWQRHIEELEHEYRSIWHRILSKFLAKDTRLEEAMAAATLVDQKVQATAVEFQLPVAREGRITRSTFQIGLVDLASAADELLTKPQYRIGLRDLQPGTALRAVEAARPIHELLSTLSRLGSGKLAQRAAEAARTRQLVDRVRGKSLAEQDPLQVLGRVYTVIHERGAEVIDG